MCFTSVTINIVSNVTIALSYTAADGDKKVCFKLLTLYYDNFFHLFESLLYCYVLTALYKELLIYQKSRSFSVEQCNISLFQLNDETALLFTMKVVKHTYKWEC